MSETPGPPDRHDECVHPIASTDPGARDDAAFADAFADRRVIGLGEATHGSREFFRLKHRILRHLVDRRGLRVVGLEANFSEALAIDDYVGHGAGDPGDALAAVHVWPWQTEEVVALLEWLRSFNEGRPPADRVRVYGFDAQYTTGPVAALRSFFRRVDPDFLDGIEGKLETVDDDGQPVQDDVEPALAAADRLVDEIATRLGEREASYVAATDRETWAQARRHCRTIARATEHKRALNVDDLERAMAVRDRAMADTVAWILDHEDADRIALWAHNGHVNRVETRASGESAPSMGANLADRYGDEYYALGFEFGGGAFQAIAPAGPDGDEYELDEVALESGLSGTLGRVLDAPDCPALFVDLESARADPQVADWLDGTARIHSVGAVFHEDDPEYHVQPYVLGAAFDGLCYVDETTRARPLDRMRSSDAGADDQE